MGRASEYGQKTTWAAADEILGVDSENSDAIVNFTQAALVEAVSGAYITSSTGLLSARPAASVDNAGDLYLATDVNGGTVYRSNGSGWVQAAPGVTEVVFPAFVQKTADETVNNSNALQDDDQLLIPVVANATYVVDMALIYSSPTAADLKLAWSAPAGATMTWHRWGPSLTVSSAGTSTIDERAGLTLASNVPIGGTGGDAAAHPRGLLITDATAGNLQFRWAQQTATVADTIVRAGSWLRAERVA